MREDSQVRERGRAALFAAELALGQSLFNESTPAGSKRGRHARGWWLAIASISSELPDTC